ncbi:MAG: hypothetical protein HFJ38_00755 [Bacilli bacterium]|nr:hypothetical protein [Bacilli bacterium]
MSNFIIANRPWAGHSAEWCDDVLVGVFYFSLTYGGRVYNAGSRLYKYYNFM